MTDIPIIFSAPMVLALLREVEKPGAGKTQTRRLAWREVKFRTEEDDGPQDNIALKKSPWQKVKPGDRLWVRENFALVGGGDPGSPIYAANWREDARARGFDNIPATAPRFTPSIHMPRWASRLTLAVTATKIERLNEISSDDAQAEGLWYCEEGDAAGFWFASPDMTEKQVWGDGTVECYMRLWGHLHGKGAWENNPEVVALTFAVHKHNIDALK